MNNHPDPIVIKTQVGTPITIKDIKDFTRQLRIFFVLHNILA